MNCERCGAETSAEGLCAHCLENNSAPLVNVPAEPQQTGIVLLGKRDAGKTTTLVLVYQDLLGDRQPVYGGLKIKEVHAVIEVDGVRVGITSKGDIGESMIHPDEEIGAKVADLIDQQCEVIVCAARSPRTSKTAVSVEETLEDDYQIIWLEKEQNRPETDRTKANEILSLVRNAIPVLS